MQRISQGGKGFLCNLLQDREGNTLAIAAASLLPLMALIGGGVDVSRAYMAKTQLQSACDSGVLAGRRAMSKSGSYNTSERAKANAMFAFNFPDATLDASGVTFVTDDNEDGQVLGSATATVPTLVMKVFEMDTVDLEVTCMAELQIGNADVMFVLDTTGSMGDPINYGEDDKIVGLRDAVEDFHKTINTAINDNRTRVRYGFVPYSSSINVKGLLQDPDYPMPADYIADVAPYQSRLAVFDDPVYTSETETLSVDYETYPSEIQQGDCYDYGDNDYPYNGHNPVTSGSPPNTVTSTEYDYVSWDRTQRIRINGKRRWVGWCKRRVWVTETNYETAYEFSNWRYTEVDYDTSTIKTFASVTYADDVDWDATVQTRGAYDPVRLAELKAAGETTGVDTTTSTWGGCIEERDTVAASDFTTIPDDAYDLDLDLVPSNDETRWKPHWADMEFYRYSYDYEDTSSDRSHVSDRCPAEMMLLTEVELSDDNNDVPQWLEDYLDDLNPEGNTYHDLGMIWGGRLTSPTGIFSANVNKDADKISVSKHLIFMTDGIMQPSTTVYSAYGIENLDNRITDRYYEYNLTDRHNKRFTAMCEAIKAQGTTIWVVAFGTSMTTRLENCASSGRAYYSSNTTELRNTFKFIAAQVADLRLGE